MRSDDDILRYLDDASRLGLRVGLEYDLGVAPSLRPGTRDALHYLIGAVHSLWLDGERLAYDDAGQFLKRRRRDYPSRDRFSDPGLQRRMLERTLEVVAQGIAEERIDILGHPTFSPIAAIGDPEAGYPAEWQDRLIEMCVNADVAIEINESYGVPHREFLVRAQRAGARFSVGSDTHFELRPLDRTEEMIAAADLGRGRFLAGTRIRR